MANKVSKLKFNNVTYDLADESSRAAINNLEGQLEATRVDLNNMRAAVGSPLTAATTSAMTDTSKIYVYTGTTTTVSGVTFTAGNWYYHDGTKWQLGGTYNETALETDTTLKLSGRAADAKVVGDALEDIILDDIVLTGTDADVEAGEYTAFITVNNLWSTTSTRKCGIYVIPDGTVKVQIDANTSYRTGVAFLTTNAHANNTSPNYASGWEKPVYVPANMSKTFVVPNDAKYFYFTKNFDGSIMTPSALTWLSSVIPGIEERIDKNTSDIADLSDVLSDRTAIDPTYGGFYAFISASNVWSTGSNRFCGMWRIPDGATSVSITANSDLRAGVAFLTTTNHVNGTAPDYVSEWTQRQFVPAGTTMSFNVPDDAKYLYYDRKYNDYIYIPEAIVWTKMIDIKDYVNNSLGLHENPPSKTALNIVKRCRQMTEIKWTPAVDLKRFMLVQRKGEIPDTASGQNYLGTFKAGVEYTGIPYGRVSTTMGDYGYDYATVGHYIPFETFVSSVSNPDSMLCKRDVGAVAGHRSVCYATVCSGLTCYALDVPERPTASIAGISGLAAIGKINNNGELLSDDYFKIGDVLNLYDNHTAIITDIIRDSDGVIQYVELSDASTSGLADRNYADGQIGGICRRKGWTREQFFAPYSWGAYTLYRYSGTVTYEPSPYVNIGDEFNMQRIEHFPCMPYEGNKFTYKIGHIPDDRVKILVSLAGYGYLKVFKDGTEITGSPFVVTSETDSVDITEISIGNYSAYLCNISNGNVTNLTYPCEWSIQ